MSFIIIGALGFVWMGFWVFMYSAPSKSKFVNKAELEYIEQDKDQDVTPVEELKEARKMSFLECFSYKQTWAFAFRKIHDRRSLVVFPFLDTILFKYSVRN